MVKFIDLKKQYLEIKKEIDDAVADVIANANFIGGSKVDEFEESFAKYCESEYCVGVGNGTDALEIAIESLDLPEYSEILVPANSFIASSEAISRAGHKPVFCDVDEETLLIDLKKIEQKITKKTKAVVAVYLYGQPINMEKLKNICAKNQLKIIGDCAQAHGAKFEGKSVAAMGDIACFSFYPGKNLGAYGDGGAVVTNCSVLHKKCKMIANHGRLSKYDHEFEGRNSRLDSLQAAVLSVKLKYIDDWTERRIKLAAYYYDNLKDVNGIKILRVASDVKHVYHLFVIRAEKRDLLRNYLKENGIESGIHYPIALNKLPAYQHLDSSDISVAPRLTSELISLPISDQTSLAEVEQVVSAIREFYKMGV